MAFEVCVYHGGCPDGIGGAWVFWRENKEMMFVAGEHGTIPDISLFEGKKVVFVDFSYKRETIIEISKVAKHICILDHHATSVNELVFDHESECGCKMELTLDMKRSGAQIAWDYVYPGELRPWFIEVIADRDLWKWELPNSKEIGNALYEFGWYTWEKMEELDAMKSTTSEDFLLRGTILTELNDVRVKKIVKRASVREFMGYRVNLITGEPGLRSEAGNVAAHVEDIDFAAFWRLDEEKGQFYISLRGRKDGIALNKICEVFGGGGHPQACGFVIHTPESKEWQEADTLKRQSMAHGVISDYFKRIE